MLESTPVWTKAVKVERGGLTPASLTPLAVSEAHPDVPGFHRPHGKAEPLTWWEKQGFMEASAVPQACRPPSPPRVLWALPLCLLLAALGDRLL